MADTDEQERIAAAPKSVTMGVDIANGLVVKSPLSLEQVKVALDHYERLEAMLRVSGPRVSNHRRDAAQYFNMALERLRELENTPIAREDSRQPLEA